MNAAQWVLAILYTAGVLACCAYALRRLHGEDRTVPWLFLGAAAVRVALVAATGSLVDPEPWEQEDIALAALAGRGFSYELLGTTYEPYGPPLYGLFSAAVYGVAGHRPWLLAVVSILVAAASVPIVYGIARRLFGRRGATWAAALAAVHPGLLVYAGKLHELNVEITLAAGIVLAAIWWAERRRTEDALALAAFIAVGSMGRPTFLFVAFPLAAWIALRAARPGELGRLAAAAALGLAILAPWTIYVSGIHGRPIFFSVTGGIVFWYGNNPAASGSGVDPSGRPVFDHVPPDLLARISDTDAIVADAALRDAAWSYIRDDPGAFVARTAQKLLYFWTIAPSWGALYPPAWRWGYLAFYAAIVALAAIGIASIRGDLARHAASLIAIASLFAVVSSAQSLFYVDGRHRWAIEPVLLSLSGGGAAVLVARYSPTLSAMSSRWRPRG